MNDEMGLISADNTSIQSIAHRTPSLRIDGMIYEGDIPDAQWHELNLTAAETLAPGHLSPPKGLDIGVLTDLGRLMHNIGSLNGDNDLVLWGTCLYVFPDVVESSRELYRKFRSYLQERRLMNSSWEDLSHIPEYSSP